MPTEAKRETVAELREERENQRATNQTDQTGDCDDRKRGES